MPRRSVKSGAQKRAEEMHAALRALRAHIESDDWAAIVEDYEKFQKFGQKQPSQEWPPKIFIKAIAELQDAVQAVQEQDPEEQSCKLGRLNATAQKSHKSLRNLLKKYAIPLEKHLAEYRANPFPTDDEGAEEAGDHESDEESPAAAPAGRSKWLKKGSDEEESEEEEEGAEEEKLKSKPTGRSKWLKKSSDEESSESEVEEAKSKPTGRSKWLKGSSDEESEEEEEEGEEDEKKKGKKKGKGKKDEEESEEEKEKEEQPQEEQKPLTQEEVEQELRDQLAARGRKKTDAGRQSQQLTRLLQQAAASSLRLRVLLALAAAQFDIVGPKKFAAAAVHVMPTDVWKRCLNTLNKVLDVLAADSALVLDETGGEPAAATDAAPGADSHRVHGALLPFLERLNEQYTRSLQNIDPVAHEYLVRMGDEASLVSLAERMLVHYHAANNMPFAAKVATIVIQHTYYKLEKPGREKEAESAAKTLQERAALVYQHGEERLRVRAVLCHVYFQAIHDRFHEARELLLRTHLQETIAYMDPQFQILFNRAMVQLGLAAFRAGLIAEAHQCLADMYSGTPIKELLGQGIALFVEKDAKEEKAERKRQIPFHMHINLDLIEACHVTSALLLEVPNMALQARLRHHAGVADAAYRKSVISRFLRKQIEHADRPMFAGPPQSARELIIAASRHLTAGEWRKCEEYVFTLKAWSVLPAVTADPIKRMLHGKIQEAGLRTFLLGHLQHYRAIGIARLATMFELQPAAVHALVTRMILEDELPGASLDQPAGVLMCHPEPSRAQALSLLLADKLAALVDYNEHTLDAKTGVVAGSSSGGSGAGTGSGGFGYRRDAMAGGEGVLMRPQRAYGGGGGSRAPFGWRAGVSTRH
eukprot:TRINITY_DN769_c0_g1_i1.p1 TRINITY_DN769_c0_g1~~TRINITY_DN769_c0_g1_i1.p1  ORF type:complete len:926 (-),score=355.52 TRINITY_DN769_c0_g1_i1:65-2683(-)